MRLAVMQPYLFPYLGYYQLVAAVDRFVSLDDVNMIVRGWVNRNRIVVDGQPRYFTAPLRDGSQNRSIQETIALTDARWRSVLLATLKHAYRDAPYRSAVLELVAHVVREDQESVADLARRSIAAVFEYLCMAPDIVPTSSVHPRGDLRGQARILDICAREGADEYVNPPGGRHLYDRVAFEGHGIALRFLVPSLPEYRQFAPCWTPGLSILDVLMHNDPASVRAMLGACDLD